ncbi:MAG TPA: hypothetical protein VGK20_17275 [Candidatus Binatia bacterium]
MNRMSGKRPQGGTPGPFPSGAPLRELRARTAGTLLAVLAAAAGMIVVAGCQSSWTPTTKTPTVPLQWPAPPQQARIRYLHALSGVVRDANAATVLGALAFGTRSGDDSFVLPVAMSISADGRIAVADTGCRCVHLLAADTGGKSSSSAYVRLTGSEREHLQSPVDVAFDDGGRLWVSDSSGALFSFDASGKFLAASRSIGDHTLQRPTGLAWSRATHRLYVVDTLAHAVFATGGDGSLLQTFGRRGSGPGELNYPTRIAEGPDGSLYVADSLNFRIVIFAPDGSVAGGFGHHGDASGDFAMPKGIAVDRDGVVYVVDAMFDNVQLFDRSGRFLLTLGGRGSDFGQFWLPSGAAIDGSGRLAVCDTYNRRIQFFQVEGSHAAAAS